MTNDTLSAIQQLIGLFEASSLTTLEVSEGSLSLRLSRGGTAAAPSAPLPVPVAEVKEEGKLLTINSPLIGTFYAAPSPDEDPFLTVGARISAKDTVGLIESMKVFTEIPAGLSGTVEKILVKNGDFVEYDQPLFQIRCD